MNSLIANIYASRKHGVKMTKREIQKNYNSMCGEVKTFTTDNYKPTIKEGYIRITK